MTDVLEKVEQDALITYNNNVGKFLQSEQFDKLLYERAGQMHEDGFNDCLKFIGAGNVVDPVLHTIDICRAEELERLEKEHLVADAGLERTEGVTEGITVGGAVPEAGGAIEETVLPK